MDNYQSFVYLGIEFSTSCGSLRKKVSRRECLQQEVYRERNTNISFPQHRATFAFMNEQFQHLIRVLSKGDTRLAESFFRRPGGRKYLENITLILIHTLAPHYGEKEEMYQGFVEILDRMEDRIRRKNEGEEILEGVFENS